VLKISVRLEKTISILIVGGLLFGSLSMAAYPVSAGPSGTPPAPQNPDLINPIYIPFMAKGISDLFISNVEVNQAVQNADATVSLVAGKPTEARIYARTSGLTPVGNLHASLAAYKNGVQIGSTLVSGPGTAYLQSDSIDSLRCGDYDSVNMICQSNRSFNFTLPANWTSAGDVTLVANIDIYNVAPELSEVNTTTLQTMFNTVPALDVTVVPVEYIHTERGHSVTYPVPDTSYMQVALSRMYPVPAVNITVHPKTTFVGNLKNDGDWDTLLNQIDALKLSEGKPASTVYFGMIPLLDGSGNTWFNYTGGVVGYGYVGYRASIAVTKALVFGDWDLHGDDFAAHEIGHNLGMDHTPCNVDSPYTYPYANGAIGQYGFNVNTQAVIDKNRPDIMSYCEPEWVSDFTYQRWYDDQKSMLARVALPSQDSVFVRAALAGDGTAKLQPVYNFAASPSDLPASSDYSIQFLDDQGKVINEYPVNVMRAEEHGHIIQAIHALLPHPTQPYSTVQVMYKGQTIDTRTVSSPAMLAASTAPTTSVDASDLVLNWSSSGSPALVRYTNDGGQTWTTAGVDVSGGELRIAMADLPAGPLQFQVIPGDGTATQTIDWAP
jgi:hypothetical protein